jgi:hypothetical protein
MTEPRVIALCCGFPREYCECPALVRAQSYLEYAALQDCPPAPRMTADDPRRDEEPPF